jgi:hypothetical protein
VDEIVKKLAVFYGTRTIIAAFKRALYWTHFDPVDKLTLVFQIYLNIAPPPAYVCLPFISFP